MNHEGFLGGVVFDSIGNILVDRLPGIAGWNHIPLVSEQLAELRFTLESLDDPDEFSEIILFGEKAATIIRAVNSLFIIIFVEHDANFFTFNVEFHSVVRKIESYEQELQSSSRLKQQQVIPTGSLLSPSRDENGRKEKKEGVLLTSGEEESRQQEISLLGKWGSHQPSSNSVGVEFVNHFYLQCKEFLGSRTKEIIIHEMMDMDVCPYSLSIGEVIDLLERIAVRVPEKVDYSMLRARILGDG